MVLLDHFNVLLKIFHWTGLAPFPSLDEKRQCYIYVVSVIVSSFLNIGLVVASFYFQLYNKYGNIETIINYTFVGSLSLSNLSAYLQCYHYKSVYIKIVHQIIKIENNFKTTFSKKNPFQTIAYRYRLKVFIITLMHLISFVLQFYELSLEQYDYKFCIIRSFTMLTQCISALTLFHVLLYICIVQMFISELNRRIRNASIDCYSETKIDFLKTIKLMHMQVWKLMMQINNFFSWNLPFLVIHLAIQTTYYFYWIFLVLQVEWNLLYIAGKIYFKIK